VVPRVTGAVSLESDKVVASFYTVFSVVENVETGRIKVRCVFTFKSNVNK
jgi:hypothetical protein